VIIVIVRGAGLTSAATSGGRLACRADACARHRDRGRARRSAACRSVG
jgi:hypothetical protein